VVAAHRHRSGRFEELALSPSTPLGIEGPLVVVTDWGRAGIIPLGVLVAAIAVAAPLYIYVLRRARPMPLLGVVLSSVAGMAVAFCARLLFSSDVYAYAAYGEMARLGLNPYAHPPAGIADPIVRAAQLQWITAFPICVYGPAFVAFARAAVAALAPFGFAAQLDAFRVAACVALLLCIVLAASAYRGDRASRLRSAAAIGLNPVAIWSAAEGHNDALALAIVLAGFAIARRSPAIGAAVAALSASVKAPGAAAAIAYALVDRRALIGTAVGLAIAWAGLLPLFAGVAGDLAPHGHYAPAVSLQAVFVPLGAPVALAAAFAVAPLLAIAGLRRLRKRDGQGWICLTIAAWSLIPNPYPWYGLWLAAVAAMSPRSRAATIAIALSLTSVLRYVPDAVGPLPTPISVALAIAASLPFAGLIPLRAVREYNERFV
jgi:hypothetical protein